jgi:hypothetical protein
MAEPAVEIDSAQSALDESVLDQRVESLITAHQGDARAVIETLLMAIGFVRGRLPAIGMRTS